MVTRRTFLKFLGAAAGAATLPQVAPIPVTVTPALPAGNYAVRSWSYSPVVGELAKLKLKLTSISRGLGDTTIEAIVTPQGFMTFCRWCDDRWELTVEEVESLRGKIT